MIVQKLRKFLRATKTSEREEEMQNGTKTEAKRWINRHTCIDRETEQTDRANRQLQVNILNSLSQNKVNFNS